MSKDGFDLMQFLYKGLNKGGHLIIKDINTKPFLMLYFTFLLDLLMNLKDSFYYRSISRWKEDLSIIGFQKIKIHDF